MPKHNTIENAERWLQLILEQPVPNQDILAAHIAAGRVDSLCTCGCNSFTYVIPANVVLTPLRHGQGLYCEITFESNMDEEINILLFTDERGYLCSTDIIYGATNIGAMPDGIVALGVIGVWPTCTETTARN